jgi:hypothetical protein
MALYDAITLELDHFRPLQASLGLIRNSAVTDVSLWHEAAEPAVGTSVRSWGLTRDATLTLACVLVTHSGLCRSTNRR